MPPDREFLYLYRREERGTCNLMLAEPWMIEAFTGYGSSMSMC